MSSELSLSQILANMEAQIASYQKQETFHTEQEIFHREQKEVMASELAAVLQSYDRQLTAGEVSEGGDGVTVIFLKD